MQVANTGQVGSDASLIGFIHRRLSMWHLVGRVSYLIYVSMQHYVLTTSGDIVVCFHTAVFELLICLLRNGVFNLLLGELYPRENEVIPELRKRRGGWPGFEVFVWRRLTSCWILSAMSPEIQEWSHKSRSRINNLYLLTRRILFTRWWTVQTVSCVTAEATALTKWTCSLSLCVI